MACSKFCIWNFENARVARGKFLGFCMWKDQTIYFFKYLKQTIYFLPDWKQSIYFSKFQKQSIYFQKTLTPPLMIKWCVPYSKHFIATYFTVCTCLCYMNLKSPVHILLWACQHVYINFKFWRSWTCHQIHTIGHKYPFITHWAKYFW